MYQENPILNENWITSLFKKSKTVAAKKPGFLSRFAANLRKPVDRTISGVGKHTEGEITKLRQATSEKLNSEINKAGVNAAANMNKVGNSAMIAGIGLGGGALAAGGGYAYSKVKGNKNNVSRKSST